MKVRNKLERNAVFYASKGHSRQTQKVDVYEVLDVLQMRHEGKK